MYYSIHIFHLLSSISIVRLYTSFAQIFYHSANKKRFKKRYGIDAEEVRFELTVSYPTTVFKTVALNHSATLPKSAAERQGFEPWVLVYPTHSLSRRARSATPASLPEPSMVLGSSPSRKGTWLHIRRGLISRFIQRWQGQGSSAKFANLTWITPRITAGR